MAKHEIPTVRRVTLPVAEAVFLSVKVFFGGYLFQLILLSNVIYSLSLARTHAHACVRTHLKRTDTTTACSHFDHKQLTVKSGHDTRGCAPLLCASVQVCLCLIRKGAVGGRLAEGALRVGPRSGFFHQENGAKFQSV